MSRVSNNGAAIVEAMNSQTKAKAITNEVEKVTSDMVLVGLSELEATNAYKAKAKTNANSLADLSSHIRVVDEDGEFEEFELVLQPHLNPSGRAKSGNTKLLNTKNTWVALSPDRFYLQEDDAGIDIYPVSFPAVSIDNPERKIEVTLDQDGTITWPEEVKNKSEGNFISDYHNEMVYLETIPNLIQPCYDCSGGGGGSGGGGNSDSGSRFENSSVQTVPFLALESIRLGSTDGDGDGALELQMIVQGFFPKNDPSFNREWNFVFDRKRGTSNLPLWFDAYKNPAIWLHAYRGEWYKLFTQISGPLFESATSVFSGRNTRTFGADNRIYQTPDVNHRNSTYRLTNMRTWSYFPREPLFNERLFNNGYTEDYRQNYFPLVMLNINSYRLVLMEDDKKYRKASRRRANTLEQDVWTFNMANGSHDKIHTVIDANRHRYGSSDDILLHSGVQNITEQNVDNLLERTGGTAIRARSFSGFEYMFKKIYRTSEFRPK